MFRYSNKEHYPEAVALSVDGARLALYYTDRNASGPSGVVEVRDLRANAALCRVGGLPSFLGMKPQFSPDGKAVFLFGMLSERKSGSYRVHACRLDIAAKRVRELLRLPEGVGGGTALTPNGKTLVLSDHSRAAVLYDLSTLKEVGRLPKEEEKMPADFPPDETKNSVPYRTRYENLTTDLAISPDGRRLAVGTLGGWLSMWDLERKKRLWRRHESDRGISHLSFNADSDRLAVLLNNGKKDLIIRHVRTGEAALAVDGRCNLFAAFLPDGDMILDRRTPVGFVRWRPEENETFGGWWGENFRPVWRPATDDDYRRRNIVEQKGRMVLSANGETVAMICTDNPKRVVAYDLRSIWRKRP